MRSGGLDLVKWVAMLAMVADHLRFLWPQAHGLFVVGRLAFPLFCLAMAMNVVRRGPDTLLDRHHGRYLGLMLLFTVLSEPAYRWLDSGSTTFSIMPTLLLGLLLAWGVQHTQLATRLLGLVALGAGWAGSPYLMYGLPGVLLPAACVLAHRYGGRMWLVPCLSAVAGNLTNSWLMTHLSAPFTWVTLTVAAVAIPVGNGLLHSRWRRVPAVGRWGYGFYPLHLLLIKAAGIVQL
ncbi:TraX family protein [Pseudomonas sp. WSY_20]|uniref:TraX family protein n=1 Tax=unclassified Pseudomonas TaxID=196821 RepID=UPI00370CF424